MDERCPIDAAISIWITGSQAIEKQMYVIPGLYV